MSVRGSLARFVAAALVTCSVLCNGQAVNPSSPKRQLDIGAAEAPLSDAERIDLDKAVTKHDYPAEKAVIDKALTEHPGSSELLLIGGRLAYLEKRPKEAADAFGRADKIKPLSEEDRMTLAIALQFSGQPDPSRAELVKLTKLAPKNAKYQYLMGRMDRQNQHLEDAAVDFANAVRVDPNLVRAYEELGQVQEELGKAGDARKTYETGAGVNRRAAVHWAWSPLDLGVFLLKADDLIGAEKLFRESLQYNPRFAWGHYYMGQLLQKQGRNVDSVGEYKAAVVNDPGLRQAWLALGREFAREGNQVEADRSIAVFKKLEERENSAKGRKN